MKRKQIKKSEMMTREAMTTEHMPLSFVSGDARPLLDNPQRPTLTHFQTAERVSES